LNLDAVRILRRETRSVLPALQIIASSIFHCRDGSAGRRRQPQEYIMSRQISIASSLAAIAGVATLALAGCGQSPAPDASASLDATPAAEQAQADAARDAELATRESELAAREAELAMKQKEQELAAREATLAAKEKAAARVAATPTKKKKSAGLKPAAVLATNDPLRAATQPMKSAKAMPITVPAGTLFSVNLSSDVSTKTAKVGDPVDARLASDLVVNGRTALAAGSPVRGTVTEVVSGSHKIGGVPTLAMTFDRLELENGKTVPINGRVVQQGKSETGKDTAKIVGGAAAGAIIGHQVDDDKGTVIGGLLGGAAGAVAAKKTGGEVNVPAGTTVTFSTDAPFQVGT
jgi:hypothetical protein